MSDLFRREPPVVLPSFVKQGLFYVSGAFTAVLVAALFAALTFAGCKFSAPKAESAPAAGKAAAASIEDARSKSSALFGTIGAQPGVTPPVQRLAEVGEHLNGAATPQDYAWAEKISAAEFSEKARAEAVALADRQAAEIKALLGRLAAAPSPEELAKAKERADRTAAELDAFASATARNGIIGAAAVLLCGVLAWQFTNARIFLWGVLASMSLNVEPYVVKRLAESPVLSWTLGILITLGAAFAVYEATKGDLVNGITADAKASAGGLPASGLLTRAWHAVRARVAAALLWIRARFGKSAPTPPAA